MNIVLTDKEIEDIKSYVLNSKYLLEEAIKNSNGKSIELQKQIFSDVIREVVLYSYNNIGFNELLMRMILNQALELTLGIPEIDGSGSKSHGILNNRISDDLLVVILSDHIKMSLEYTKSDLKFLESKNYLDTPFNDVGINRVVKSQEWISGIFNVEIQNQVYKSVFDRFLSTTKRNENLRQKEVSDLFYKIYQLKETYSSHYSLNRAYRRLMLEFVNYKKNNLNLQEKTAKKIQKSKELGQFSQCIVNLRNSGMGSSYSRDTCSYSDSNSFVDCIVNLRRTGMGSSSSLNACTYSDSISFVGCIVSLRGTGMGSSSSINACRHSDSTSFVDCIVNLRGTGMGSSSSIKACRFSDSSSFVDCIVALRSSGMGSSSSISACKRN